MFGTRCGWAILKAMLDPWPVAVASVPLAHVVRAVPRRHVLAGLLAALVVSSLVAAVATTYWLLLMARLLAALAQALSLYRQAAAHSRPRSASAALRPRTPRAGVRSKPRGGPSDGFRVPDLTDTLWVLPGMSSGCALFGSHRLAHPHRTLPGAIPGVSSAWAVLFQPLSGHLAVRRQGEPGGGHQRRGASRHAVRLHREVLRLTHVHVCFGGFAPRVDPHPHPPALHLFVPPRPPAAFRQQPRTPAREHVPAPETKQEHDGHEQYRSRPTTDTRERHSGFLLDSRRGLRRSQRRPLAGPRSPRAEAPHMRTRHQLWRPQAGHRTTRTPAIRHQPVATIASRR
ncbi:hypothetical protein CG747_44820 [Streptomyces sp. CB02959]|nr:hypothetical protein CG747_44820 [Streptomyces sp. CB02959]